MTISELTRQAPVLSTRDTIRRAAGLIHGSEGAAVLVASNGQIVGMVDESSIARFLSASENLEEALGSPVEPLVEPSPVFVNSALTLREAAEIFGNTDADMLPVIDERGAYRGVIYRSDIIGTLTKTLKPPTVAGMATPLGVYLTTGSITGGAGNLGLFLTGVSLMLMIAASSVIVSGLESAFVAVSGIKTYIYHASPPLTMRFNVYDVVFYVTTALNIGIMLLLLRLSPLAGYHAAEHMTVHAIEAGETLTPDSVRRMPRVHGRCGTNLLAAAGVFLILTTKVHSELSVLVALIVVVIGWRAVGSWLQYFVTTKTPSEKQLANGVAAGNQLLERYHERPNYQVYGFDRIWNLGFLQTASGMLSVGLIIYVLEKYAHIAGLERMLF
ncbi:MAG: hypothetical protein A2Z18_05200 [Armatimonadetes bacterium RBG_16_58_9]|nr:MAG: hypothetical protein A2Z18_05200 [Armatimonadetes bacterium RBG_16_58_9]